MISISSNGSFSKFHKYLESQKTRRFIAVLDEYGRLGVEALRNSTPRDTGEMAANWEYEIVHSKNSVEIVWKNNKKTAEGTPIAILVQYGHATGSGAWVEGKEYINSALEPIFEDMAARLEMEVKSL